MDIDVIAEIINVVDIEIAGLSRLKENINSSFKEAIQAIYNCRGKVILTGMGKSGLIAKKIASTFSSLGTPAIFMHSAEGMHGDLGMITANDIVIAIGKSGESAELSGIITPIKIIGAKVIAITGNTKSTLAKISDIIIDIGDPKEACSFDMIPTTSSTVTLVIGDALAVVLMKIRGFELDDFALFHPGGQIGKRLIMTVADVMLKDKNNPVINIMDKMKNCIMKISDCHLKGNFENSGLICKDCDQRNEDKSDVLIYNSKFDISERVEMTSSTYAVLMNRECNEDV